MTKMNGVRITVAVIAIILVIVAIVFQAMDKVPLEWSKLEGNRNFDNTEVANTTLATSAAATDEKYKDMAKLVLIALADKHCTLHHCDKNGSAPIRFFLKVKGGNILYAASLKPGQYQVLYVTPGDDTLLAELTEEISSSTGVEQNKNKAVSLRVNLTENEPTYVTATHAQGMLDEDGDLALSQVSEEKATNYLHSALFHPADDDPIIINTKSGTAPLYEGVVQSRGYHYNLKGYRLIRCNIGLKSGNKITCIYDFFRNSSNNQSYLVTQNSSCPALSTVLKKDELGLNLDCYFMGVAGYAGTNTITGNSPSANEAATATGYKVTDDEIEPRAVTDSGDSGAQTSTNSDATSNTNTATSTNHSANTAANTEPSPPAISAYPQSSTQAEPSANANTNTQSAASTNTQSATPTNTQSAAPTYHQFSTSQGAPANDVKTLPSDASNTNSAQQFSLPTTNQEEHQ